MSVAPHQNNLPGARSCSENNATGTPPSQSITRPLLRSHARACLDEPLCAVTI